jgi:hypothetical protein
MINELPVDILIYIMSYLDIMKFDIIKYQSINKDIYKLSKQPITIEYYPWNKKESFNGLTKNYHNHRIEHKRILEISNSIDFDKELEHILLENNWL